MNNPTFQLAQGKITSMPRDKKSGERLPMQDTSFQEQAKTTRKKRGTRPRIRGPKITLTNVLDKPGYRTFRLQLLQPLGSGCLTEGRIAGDRGQHVKNPPPSEETETKNVKWRDAYPSLDSTSGWQSSRLLEVGVNLGSHSATLAKSG